MNFAEDSLGLQPGHKVLRVEYPQVGNSRSGAGTMTTAGGLVFFGDDAQSFEAVDARTGKPLWHFNTGQDFSASPMGYAVQRNSTWRSQPAAIFSVLRYRKTLQYECDTNSENRNLSNIRRLINDFDILQSQKLMGRMAADSPPWAGNFDGNHRPR